MFTLTIQTDGAAFEDEEGGNAGPELARMLHVLADMLARRCPDSGGGNLRDVNGNTCGKWALR